MRNRRQLLLASVSVLMGAIGCGYTTRGLYPTDIQTVAVPIFKSNTLRRDLEFVLTEKVIQAIEMRTPYKVVPSERADTEIRGTITSYFKNPFGEDFYDNPRGGNMFLNVRVEWIDKRSGKVLSDVTVSPSASAPEFMIIQQFTIDTAQSLTTATDDAFARMAEQIVSLLQTPW